MTSRDPLHGVTLERMLDELVAGFGWHGLGQRIRIRSFTSDPSIASSLKFLRKTPWARAKVESLYRFMLRERARQAPVVAAPYGSWKSPITAELIARPASGSARSRSRGRDIFWIEGRPQDRVATSWSGAAPTARCKT